MAKKGSSNSGFKGFIASAITIVILCSVVVGWARVNNITDIQSGYNYFKSWADNARECGAGELEWNCEMPGGNGGSGSGSNGGEAGGNTGGNNGGNAGGQPANPGNPATPSDRSALEASLDSIPVKDSEEVNYSRSEWKHWNGSPCDTRETVLKNQGTNVVTDPSSCKVLSGQWSDKYSGETFTEAGKLDIDHVVPLSYAAKNGGQKLSAEQKVAFANDLEGLYISDAGENRSKSDKGPGDYLPPNASFQCEYVSSFIHMVKKYNLSMPKKDVTAARAVIINKC